MQLKRQSTFLLGALSFLLIPLIAMQFTDDVNWKLGDFIVAGFLLLLLGFSLNYISQSKLSKWKMIFSFFTVLLVFLLVWAELAVGLFGSPFAGQ